jgi:hypothetical protein
MNRLENNIKEYKKSEQIRKLQKVDGLELHLEATICHFLIQTGRSCEVCKKIHKVLTSSNFHFLIMEVVDIKTEDISIAANSTIESNADPTKLSTTGITDLFS